MKRSTREPVPFVFGVAGVFSACFTVIIGMAACAGPVDGGWKGVALRVVAVMLTALSGVVTEALWRVRPWVWHASLALALTYTAAALAWAAAGPAARASGVLILLLFSATLLVPLLAYIRGCAMTMWPRGWGPRTSARVAAPRPAARP